MLAFWEDLLEPLIDSLLPETILEVGSDQGATTRALLEYAQSSGGTVHAIDPKPQFDVAALQREYPDALDFHLGLSLDVLPSLGPVDFALIDGDHNWYTVLNELRLLEQTALDAEKTPPVIALHDIGWPYGRRDLYYDPENIPADKRKPFARRAIHPDREELGEEGINPHLANAERPADRHSGVLGAVDDFIAESDVEWKLFKVQGEHGLGVLATAETLEERGKTSDLLESTGKPKFLRRRVKAVERARIETEIRRVRASRLAAAKPDQRLAEVESERDAARAQLDSAQAQLNAMLAERDAARAKVGEAHEDADAVRRELSLARDELDDAERRLARIKRQRDSADEREVELEEELAEERRKLRQAMVQVEEADDRQRRAAARMTEVEEDLDAIRSETEAAEAATRAAESRVAALEKELEESTAGRAWLTADFEESRESLERTIDELRGQADTGMHAAAEMREMLEERELEVQRLDTQTMKLQTALGRARAEAEIAQSERSALERRLEDLAARYESALDEIAAGLAAPAEPPSEPTPAPAVPSPPAATPPAPGPAAPVEAESAPPAPVGDAQPPVEAVPSRPPTGPELEARASFTAEYQPLSESGIDPLALPAPHDRRGMLRSASDPTVEGPSVDVVVCVHNALEDVRRCLWSLSHKASYPFRLILVNDGSDEETSAFLRSAAIADPAMTLIENTSPPHGYTIAANLGMREAESDYVVLLNSDTIVTYGWLERIIACGESDEQIGILGPLSNAASHQSIPELRDGDSWATNPLPDFATEDGVAKLLERVSSRARPRFPFINGFCYVVKRAVFDRIGYFDEENFASGYCEENDFSYRAGEAGFELAVVDDAYVFHAKSKSFTPEVRKPIATRNYEIFLAKHGAEQIKSRVRELEEDTSLKPLRYAVAEGLSSSWDMASALDLASVDPLDVTFILPGLGAGGSGGSHSVYQEVKGMREFGVPARVMLPERAFDRAEAAYSDAREIFIPFSDIDDLARKTARADVISATHFKSVAMLAELRERRDDFLPAYYVQDYEPFFTSEDSADVQEAIESYTAVEDCLLFAKTHWLCNIVGDRHDLHVAKVEPSIDERVYQLNDIPRGEGPLRVVAMVRPRTPRRQPTATLAVLEELHRRFGDDVELVTFGCSADDMVKLTSSVPLLANHQGILTRHEVANLLNRSDVFLDMSMYQAFGRTALEAMACACTAVVPRLGGVWEFVEEDVNAYAVDTLDLAPATEALSELAREPALVRSMQEAGRRTAARYSIGRAALSEYLVFSQEYARRFGGDRVAG